MMVTTQHQPAADTRDGALADNVQTRSDLSDAFAPGPSGDCVVRGHNDLAKSAHTPTLNADVHSEGPMSVSMCVCHNITFDDLKGMALTDASTFETLRERTGCGSGCGMCEPYIRLMLKTGQTRFRPLTRLSIARVMAEARRDQHADTPAVPAIARESV